MLRILANDGMDKDAVQKLQELGSEVVLESYSIEELKTELKNFDCIVVRSATKIREELIDAVADSRLKLIVRAGTGIDNIDVKYAESKGIRVRNTPNSNPPSVAELAIGHMLALARFINVSNVTMRNDEWNKKKYTGTEIAGKTLGVIGFGRIGKELAKKALALGMHVNYTDVQGETDEIPECRYLTETELLKTSDYISLHIPFIKSQGPAICRDKIKMMKDGVYLINCARGGVVCEDGLLEALNSGKVAGVGLDAFMQEPTHNMELVNHPRVCATPHIGASTVEAQKRIGDEIFSVILEELSE